MSEPEEQRSAVQKLRDRLPFGGRASEDSDPEVLELGVGARIKVVGTDADLVVDLGATPDVAVMMHPIVGASRVEIQELLHEQAVSITLHRFGNRFADMHRLRDELMG